MGDHDISESLDNKLPANKVNLLQGSKVAGYFAHLCRSPTLLQRVKFSAAPLDHHAGVCRQEPFDKAPVSSYDAATLLLLTQ